MGKIDINSSNSSRESGKVENNPFFGKGIVDFLHEGLSRKKRKEKGVWGKREKERGLIQKLVFLSPKYPGASHYLWTVLWIFFPRRVSQ